MSMAFDWRRLFYPQAWSQNYPTSFEWDAALSDAMDRNPVVKLSKYSARVGPYVVWIENWPHAYGCPWDAHNCCREIDVLPLLRTRFRLRHLVGPPDTGPTITDYLRAKAQQSGEGA